MKLCIIFIAQLFVVNRTKYSECVLGLDGLWCSVAEDRHHVQKVLEGAIAVLTRAEDFAYTIAERVDSQLRVLQYLGHRQLSVSVVSNFLWRESLELLVSTAKLLLKNYYYCHDNITTIVFQLQSSIEATILTRAPPFS